jgi:hypothetical protein
VSVELLDDPSTGDDIWFAAGNRSQVEVGIYIPADVRFGKGGSPFSVFWRGRCTREWLRTTVTRAEDHLRTIERVAGVSVSAALLAFGPTREKVERPAAGLGTLLETGHRLGRHAAYRAEFHLSGPTSSQDELSIWANVEEDDQESLGQAGENVGIAITPNLYFGFGLGPSWFGSSLIKEAICATRPQAEGEIDDILRTVDTIRRAPAF